MSLKFFCDVVGYRRSDLPHKMFVMNMWLWRRGGREGIGRRRGLRQFGSVSKNDEESLHAGLSRIYRNDNE